MHAHTLTHWHPQAPTKHVKLKNQTYEAFVNKASKYF